MTDEYHSTENGIKHEDGDGRADYKPIVLDKVVSVSGDAGVKGEGEAYRNGDANGHHANGNGHSNGVKDEEDEDEDEVKKEEKPAVSTDMLFSPGSPKRDIPLSTRSPSRSPSPKREAVSSGTSEGASGSRSRGRSVQQQRGPTLIGELPTAWDAAHETFTTLEKCVYERKELGLSREQDEMMVCDCVFDRRNPDAQPCSEHSDCINRALFIECIKSQCNAKSQCKNQRFAERQYAPVDIVQTEMKGFGLRAAADIPCGSLIYEYIGEVVMEKTFRKRMAQYADEGIRHFYFMMLQKEEYIDATKKGGIGRFANHSCNPNCEVQKWVVGRRLRMGIFTKRDVVKDEEITFNYNVDRYGHDAQICYCGEPNCVGYIGGKTQTDIGTMNDLFIDALGITDQVEELQLKGNRKKKSKQLDEDFVPTLRPMEDSEVQKVAAAIRQSGENSKMMSRLLQRVNMTEQQTVHRQLMRMHGFGLMHSILTQQADERDVVLLALETMTKWKLQLRNKIEDSNIEQPVKALAEGDDPELAKLASGLLEYWSTLEMSYKIPRKQKIASLDEEDEAATTTIAEADLVPRAEHRRPQAWENTTTIAIDIAPVRPRPPPVFARSRPLPPPPPPTRPSLAPSASSDKMKLDAIIAMAQGNLVASAAAAGSASPAGESSRSEIRHPERDDDPLEASRRKRVKREEARPVRSAEEEEKRKEKRVAKMVGEVVVRSMSKYKDMMEHETFKRYAKECTMILVEKEKKGSSYASHSRPAPLSEDKKAKIKSFTKEYVHKVLKKLKEKGKLKKHPQAPASSRPSSTPSLSISTPGRLSTSAGMETPGGGVQTPGVDTPNGGDHGALVSDIFGADDEDDNEEDGGVRTRGTSERSRDEESIPGASPHAGSVATSPLSTPVPTRTNGAAPVGAFKIDSFRP